MPIKRSSYPIMRSLMFIILLVGLILVNHNDQANGLKKKKMLKKIKDALPLMLALKPKKKILLLPIPFPIKGKGKGGGSALGLLQSMRPAFPALPFFRGMRPLGNIMDSWGPGPSNYGGETGPIMMFPMPAPIIHTPPPPPPRPAPLKMIMVPMPMPEYTAPALPTPPLPQPEPIMSYHSPIDQLNNHMMKEAMDTWMMMAAMDCFGMDNQIHSHGSRDISDKIVTRPRPTKHHHQNYRSPAQLVREIGSKVSLPKPVPLPAPVYHYEPVQRPIQHYEHPQQQQQHDTEGFDPEPQRPQPIPKPQPEPVKVEKIVEYPVKQPIQQQPIQQQQQHYQQQQSNSQTYFPTSEYVQSNRFAESTKSKPASIKGTSY